MSALTTKKKKIIYKPFKKLKETSENNVAYLL